MSFHSSKRRRLDTSRQISPPPLQRDAKKQDVPRPCQMSVATEAPCIKQIETSTPQHGMRRLSIISWNINGITHLLPKTQKSIKEFFRHHSPQGEDSHSDGEQSVSGESPLRKFLKRHNFPQVLCLQEVKIAPTDLTTRRAVEKAANGPGPRYTALCSLPRDKFNARGWGGKVYGVCSLIRADLPISTTKEVKWDLEGRVLITTFEEWKLAIINGYWVNGTMNPYRDSVTGHVIGTRHDRKRAFHSLMLEQVKRLQHEGYEVLLVGDMNVACSALDGHPGIRLGKEHVLNRQDFNAKFFNDEDGMRGIDTWRHMHGETRGYTYHGESISEWGRSCDRVDLAIATRGLVDSGALVGADIWESVEERGGSDHVPLGVTLDVDILRGKAQDDD